MLTFCSSTQFRSTARQKLTRLTIQQFHELSTDVYDELVRRKGDTEGRGSADVPPVTLINILVYSALLTCPRGIPS